MKITRLIIASALSLTALVGAVSAQTVEVTTPMPLPIQGVPAQRQLMAVKYNENKQATVIMSGTALAPRVLGKADVEYKQGRTNVRLEMDSFTNPQSLGGFYTTYVLWAVAPEGQAENLMELPIQKNFKIESTTKFQTFGLMITAEPHARVALPSSMIVAENTLRKGSAAMTTSKIEYSGDPGTFYLFFAPNSPNANADYTTPLMILGARRVVEIAQRADAKKFAEPELQAAELKLAELEQAWPRSRKASDLRNNAKKNSGLAHDVMRIAEQARKLSVTRNDEAELAAERLRAGANLAQSQAATDRAKNETDRARYEANRAATDAGLARTDAERARAETERAQAAERTQSERAARADSEIAAARLRVEQAQSETDKAKANEELVRAEAGRARTETGLANVATERAQTAEREGTTRAANEVAAARMRVEQAQSETEKAKANQELARAEADSARLQTSTAQGERDAAQRERDTANRERDTARQSLFVSLSAILETRREARGMIVNLSDVLFDTGKATIKPGAREKLSKLAGILSAYSGAYQMEIEGHTDSVGSDDSNLNLSRGRAEAVRDYLTHNGVKAERMIAARGFGESKPVTENETAAGRQANRRVEIIIADQPDKQASKQADKQAKVGNQ